MQCALQARGRSAFAAAPSVHVQRPPAPTVAYGLEGPWKPWKKLEVNDKGNWVRKSMHVKVGDTVVVIAGADRGKTGKITRTMRKYNKVVIDGVNVCIRHLPPMTQGEKGERKEEESPINASNVMHWSEKEQVRSRLGHKIVDGKKVRYLKKTGESLEN